MPIDDRTTGRSYPLPNATNYLSEDVLRLRDALASIDVDISGLLTVIATLAPSATPAFTGTPQAPTAAPDTNTAQLATTAFVIGQKGTATPLSDTTNGTAGSSLKFSSQDHRHPIDTSRAPVDSPTFTGTPAGPTPEVGDNSTRLATTEFVSSQGYVKQTRTVFTAPGLTGGGDLSSNRTLGPDLATTSEAQTGSAASVKLMTPGLTAAAITAQTATIAENASSAVSSANAAESTANAAQSTANAAQSTANAAAATANQASQSLVSRSIVMALIFG